MPDLRSMWNRPGWFMLGLLQDLLSRWLTQVAERAAGWELSRAPGLGGLDTFHLGNSCEGSLGFLTAWQLAHKHKLCRAKRKGIALVWSNLVTLLHAIGHGGCLINLVTRREDYPSDPVQTRGMQGIGSVNLKIKTQSRQGKWVMEWEPHAEDLTESELSPALNHGNRCLPQL